MCLWVYVKCLERTENANGMTARDESFSARFALTHTYMRNSRFLYSLVVQCAWCGRTPHISLCTMRLRSFGSAMWSTHKIQQQQMCHFPYLWSILSRMLRTCFSPYRRVRLPTFLGHSVGACALQTAGFVKIFARNKFASHHFRRNRQHTYHIFGAPFG